MNSQNQYNSMQTSDSQIIQYSIAAYGSFVLSPCFHPQKGESFMKETPAKQYGRGCVFLKIVVVDKAGL
jgi:hypothetical protein